MDGIITQSKQIYAMALIIRSRQILKLDEMYSISTHINHYERPGTVYYYF